MLNLRAVTSRHGERQHALFPSKISVDAAKFIRERLFH